MSAAYVNHGLRPKVAAQEESFCRNLCAELEVPFDSTKVDVRSLSQQTGKGIQESARDLRYEALNLIAERLDCNRIALGHHQDDQVETVLFRILRGTGGTGLAGIPIKRDNIVRPLFDITRAQIIDFLEECGQPYRRDKSNESLRYSRNLIRHRLLPEIRRRINPRVDAALLNLSETATEDEIVLKETTEKALRRLSRLTPGGKIELALTKFNAYDIAIRRRMLRHCVTAVSGGAATPEKTAVDRMIRVANGELKALSLAEGVRMVRVSDLLLICPVGISDFRLDLRKNRKCPVYSSSMTISCRDSKLEVGNWKSPRRSCRVQVDSAKLTWPLSVRNIRAGDRFVPLGMTGTKKVGDYLTDRKVDKVYRDEIPVVCDSTGIVWLVGFEIAERVKIDKKTKRVMTIGVNKPGKRATAAI